MLPLKWKRFDKTLWKISSLEKFVLLNKYFENDWFTLTIDVCKKRRVRCEFHSTDDIKLSSNFVEITLKYCP